MNKKKNIYIISLFLIFSCSTEKNNVEENNKPQKLESYYENGSIKDITEIRDGKNEGQRSTYYENGNIKLIEHFRSDSVYGFISEFDTNGVLETKRRFIKLKELENGNEYKRADVIVYNQDGTIKESSLYSNITSRIDTIYDTEQKYPIWINDYYKLTEVQYTHKNKDFYLYDNNLIFKTKKLSSNKINVDLKEFGKGVVYIKGIFKLVKAFPVKEYIKLTNETPPENVNLDGEVEIYFSLPFEKILFIK